MFETKIQYQCIKCDANISKVEKEEHRCMCEKCFKISEYKKSPEGIAEEAANDMQNGLQTATAIIKEVTKALKDNPEFVDTLGEFGKEIVMPVIGTITEQVKKQSEKHINARTETYLRVVTRVKNDLGVDTKQAMDAAAVIMTQPTINI
jgi:predicted fused transcriptional regulator/phosphomethylpyrimidine kinase